MMASASGSNLSQSNCHGVVSRRPVAGSCGRGAVLQSMLKTGASTWSANWRVTMPSAESDGCGVAEPGGAGPAAVPARCGLRLHGLSGLGGGGPNGPAQLGGLRLAGRESQAVGLHRSLPRPRCPRRRCLAGVVDDERESAGTRTTSRTSPSSTLSRPLRPLMLPTSDNNEVRVDNLSCRDAIYSPAWKTPSGAAVHRIHFPTCLRSRRTTQCDSLGKDSWSTTAMTE